MLKVARGEPGEVRMYGVTEYGMRQAVESRLRITTPTMLAASIMSDAQELMQTGDIEDARQALNRAKWILFEYTNTRG